MNRSKRLPKKRRHCQKSNSEVTIMCCNLFDRDNCSLWIILVIAAILLFSCCGD